MFPLKAISLSLGKLKSPVLTKYQLGVLIHNLYKDKNIDGINIGVQREYASRNEFNRYLKQLTDDGVISKFPGLSNSVYTILGQHSIPADEVACIVDPFCYVSHLSAMAYHGITNRNPTTLFLSSPGQLEWKQFALKMMIKDLGDSYQIYVSNEMPRLQRIKFTKIGKTRVNIHHSKHLGAYKLAADRPIRVTTIGRTFLDAIQKPSLCGGINHVIETYEKHAERYLKLITNEVEMHGKAIDRSRVGYILNERMGIENETINSWADHVQRGGSQKLDATSEYVPEWSEKWCLSLNINEY